MLKKLFTDIRELWPTLSGYERFERTIAAVLMLLTATITLFAIARLAINLFHMFIVKVDFLDYDVFQIVFGMMMTILIALEFNRSIAAILRGRSHLFQVRSVVLIGIMALVRKFIILDLSKTSAEAVVGLAVATVALAAVYWALAQRAKGAGV